MKQQTLPVNGPVTVIVEQVGGDLQVVGWERAEVTAKTDDNALQLVMEAEVMRTRSDGDLIIYLARDAALRILNVGGDADLRAVAGMIEITSVGGDLQMRNVGAVQIVSVGGDLSLRGCSGAFQARSVGGDASLHEIKGDVVLTVGADLYLRGPEGNVTARVGSDAALYLHPQPGKTVNVQAGSDILLRLPAKTDVELDLQGCDDESIRVDLPGVEPVQMGMSRAVVMGSGGAKIKAVAGAEVIVTSRNEEWENVAEFDPLGREGLFAPGEFPGLSSDLHERISRRVEAATRRALEASMRTQEQSDRVQRRVDTAMRRAEEKMRSAENRSMHMGIKVGRFGATLDRPSVPPVPPVPPFPPRPPVEPVTDQERLTILKMLQDKKISLQDAEKLLSALEGK
jgi:hypothetical protein